MTTISPLRVVHEPDTVDVVAAERAAAALLAGNCSHGDERADLR